MPRLRSVLTLSSSLMLLGTNKWIDISNHLFLLWWLYINPYHLLFFYYIDVHMLSGNEGTVAQYKKQEFTYVDGQCSRVNITKLDRYGIGEIHDKMTCGFACYHRPGCRGFKFEDSNPGAPICSHVDCWNLENILCFERTIFYTNSNHILLH